MDRLGLNTVGETNRTNQEKLISLPSHQSHELDTTTHPRTASHTTTLHGYAEYLTLRIRVRLWYVTQF